MLPSQSPTIFPPAPSASNGPSIFPTSSPAVTSASPSAGELPSQSPTIFPPAPSGLPSLFLSNGPSIFPTSSPAVTSASPSAGELPSQSPTIFPPAPSGLPSLFLSNGPSIFPTSSLAVSSASPSASVLPSQSPTIVHPAPSGVPSLFPSNAPSIVPTSSPVEPLPELEIFVQHDQFGKIRHAYPCERYEGSSSFPFTFFVASGEETKWTITDENNGQLVASRQSIQADSFQAVSVKVDLSPGQYSFEVTDSDQFQDGICCGFGIGFYELRVNDQVLTRGGDFAFSTGKIRFAVKDGNISLLDEAVMGLPSDCFRNDPTRFDICFYLTSKVPNFGTEWTEAFSAAKATWENIIIGDERPNGVLVESVEGELPTPLAVDDIFIKGEADAIDGPGGILGQAGTKQIKVSQFHSATEAFLTILIFWLVNHFYSSSGPETGASIGKINPVNGELFLQVARGSMTFDTADIEEMIADGSYEDVIIHEVGHVLGIGTLWTFNGLHSGISGDPVYNGPLAQEAYKKLGFPGDLEIEIDHGEYI